MKKKKSLIGRITECERLDRCMNEDSAQLVVVYGRRRVGKTYLINEYFKNSFSFKLTGVYGQSKKEQLSNFLSELNRQSNSSYATLTDWSQAFLLLREYIETLSSRKKHIIFFDELPWLDTQKSGFLSALEFFWNDFASTKRNLVLILCGSVTSWMDEKITKNKGGLFNRQTCKLYLEPFKLYEVEEFLINKDITWSRYDIAECYMIMGGIPYYLNLLDPKLSIHQNIDNLFFKKRGELWDEFDHLYDTLFSNSKSHITVVSALSKNPSGLTRNEIIKKTKIPNGGDLSKILSNLVLSGFIVASNYYGRKKRDIVYQLADYYSAFYFKFIKNNYGKDEHFWSNSTDNPAKRAWQGLTFERLCKDHIRQIKHKLGISGVLSSESSWFTVSDEDKGISGAQIDLLIDRRDHVVTICEMKFSVKEYEINKNYDMNLRNKIDTFIQVTNCKKTIQLVMVTTYGVKQGKHSGLIGNQVLLDDLFHK